MKNSFHWNKDPCEAYSGGGVGVSAKQVSRYDLKICLKKCYVSRFVRV